jgi:hypothetical protein
VGNEKQDFLFGQGGDDQIAGNRGLVGGPGPDAFVFRPESDNDVIKGFTAGPGMFDHMAFEDGLRWQDLTITDTDKGALISWQGGSVLLEGVAKSALAQDDFMFSDKPGLPPGHAGAQWSKPRTRLDQPVWARHQCRFWFHPSQGRGESRSEAERLHVHGPPAVRTGHQRRWIALHLPAVLTLGAPARGTERGRVTNERSAVSLRGMVLLAGLAASLSACVPSHQELLARDRQDCTGFGFQPGSQAYAECLLRLDAARQSHGHSYAHHF